MPMTRDQPAVTKPHAAAPTDADAALVARARLGDAAAFTQLVTRHQARVYALARRLLGWRDDVHDVVQDVFLAAYEKLGRFRGDASFASWIATLTVNRCRTLLRRQLLWERMIRWLPWRQVEAASQTGDDREVVRQAVRRLPARDREVIVLRYFEQLSIAEMAQVLRVRPNTVEVRLSRAKAKLRTMLKGMDDE